jgi:16S rRNA (guanine966-N2)-methyltransferase
MGVGEQRVRIVAGTHRGRRFAAPPGDSTRPTTDRVREAVFSSLTSLAGPHLGGGPALDAFAGSGALGLEALSRGSASVTFVESEARALTVLKGNITALDLMARSTVVRGDVMALARRGAVPGGPFALLLLDPPYRLALNDVALFLASLEGNNLLADGAITVFEHAAGNGLEWQDRFSLATRKKYGTTEIDIAIYERGD